LEAPGPGATWIGCFDHDGRIAGTREAPTIDAILDELRTLAR
jgi:hypothetical protein